VKRCVFNPGLNCPRLIYDEQSCDGSTFQMADAVDVLCAHLTHDPFGIVKFLVLPL